MQLPSNVTYAQVVAQWVQALPDDTVEPTDVDEYPDARAPIGKITFTPSVGKVLDVTAVPNPVSLILKPIVCSIDLEGYLTGPQNTRGVWLVASLNDALNPSQFTWTVTEEIDGLGKRNYALPAVTGETVVDLALASPVAVSSGVAIVRGMSAYEVAIAGGFVGTEAEWLVSLIGPEGTPGAPASLVIGEVIQGPAGSVITPTSPRDYVLDLTLPPGPANALSIGTVGTGETGDAASVTITGVAPEQVLDLVLPKGATGANAEWLGGAADPDTGAGLVGFWYLNYTSFDLFEKTDTAVWTPRGNIKGATGNPGSGSVSSVNGDAGPAVVLDAASLGLGNVENLDTAGIAGSAALSAAYAQRAPDWTTARAYVVGELVTNAGALYRVTTAHTSGGSFDASKFTAVGGAVSSVAGRTGVVTLAKADVGLGSVDNTADTAKPVSTAQGAADALALAKASNLSDVADAPTARGNLGLGSAAVENVDAFAASNDARITGAVQDDDPQYLNAVQNDDTRYLDAVQSTDVTTIDQVTQAQYDALSPPDASTMYVVVG